MYDSLYGLATRSTHPRVNPTYYQNRDIDLPTTTDISYSQRSSSCIQRLGRPQLPAMIVQLYSTTRLTPASSNDRPAAHIYDSTIPATDIIHLTEDKYYSHELYTRACKLDNKLSSLLYLLPRICFLLCLWLSLFARFNLNHLRGRRAYRLRNTS